MMLTDLPAECNSILDVYRLYYRCFSSLLLMCRRSWRRTSWTQSLAWFVFTHLPWRFMSRVYLTLFAVCHVCFYITTLFYPLRILTCCMWCDSVIPNPIVWGPSCGRESFVWSQRSHVQKDMCCYVWSTVLELCLGLFVVQNLFWCKIEWFSGYSYVLLFVYPSHSLAGLYRESWKMALGYRTDNV